MKKKLMSALLAAAMVVSLTACGGSNGASGDKTYNVGICQLVEHPALDAATQGFVDALTEKLGDQVTFDTQNAQGDAPTCSTITNTFAANNYDLILANATPALLAAISSTSSIPILGTSVTDYATAMEIDEWTGVTGTNVSGTSDLAPLDQQAEMILPVEGRERAPDKPDQYLRLRPAVVSGKRRHPELVRLAPRRADRRFVPVNRKRLGKHVLHGVSSSDSALLFI